MIGTSSLAAALPPAAVEPTMRSNISRSPGTNTDTTLEPAVTLDLSPAAEAAAALRQDLAEPPAQAGYKRDPQSQQMVFQVVGRDGTVIEQLPSEAVLRARTYAREAEARAAEIGTAVVRSA